VQTLTRNLERTGPIVAARVVRPQDELAIVTAQGMALRTKVTDVPSQGRAAGGARLMVLDSGDTVASIARLSANESAEPAPA